LWQFMQDVLGRPVWSAGITIAPFVPVAWHERQSARPCKVCGIKGITLVEVGEGVGVIDGVGVVIPLVQETTNNINNTITTKINAAFFFM
jgi:hypothetical protein